MIRFLQTPGPLKKIILGGLLLIICAAMVITLVPGGIGSSFGFGAPGRGVLAKVAGEDVTTAEVQREARMMLRRQFPRGNAMAAQLLPFFASRAAEQLITEKAILAEADRLGLHVSDQELSDELQHGRYAAAFFPDGKFIGTDAYEARIQQADMTVPQFEQTVKDEILFDKLRNLVAGSAFVTDAEVHEEFVRRNTKVKFDYAVLRKDDIAKEIHPSEAELQAYYASHQASYNNSIPEKRKVEYVLIDTAKLQAQVSVTRDDLQAYYDQHRDEYRVPEQVNVRQILIKTPLPGPDGKVDQKGVDEARAKAEDVLKQLKAGASFEDLAKKYSEDPSGKTGGSIGWIRRGGFPVPEVDSTAFSLPKGGTSDVINAGYAFVILHIDDRQTAHMKTLDEVKDQIEPAIRQEKASRAADAAASSLLGQARTGGLEKAAAAKGLQLVTTDFITRSDALPGIGPSPAFMDAVFNAREKTPDETQLPQGFALFQVLAVKPPATPTFEEIRSRVETEFKNERTTALLTQKTQELSDRAKAEHDLKKAAKELGATMKTSDFVLPDGQVPDIGSMTGAASEAFSMKPGEISGPIDNGNTGAVLQLLEKQEPSQQDFAAKKDQVRDSLLQTKQNELFNLFVANLRDQMQKAGKIRINQEEMKGLTRGQGGEEGE
ncbi:MAG TPA: peptidyl-prolyl cis-trans isomerase [Terriglobales bacterium]|jgi:peptidyl-prolyl cis-trans isomerase D|nr:peptidyl-prolyl cis-trans isomerase [Terriglobales bacterium]